MKIKFFTRLLIATLLIFSLACQNTNSSTSPEENNPVDSNNATTLPMETEDVTEDYINTNRVIWQKPDLVINLLGDLSDKTVADIGAGTGFFALRIAPLSRKVIAIDIEQEFIQYLDSIKIMELPENIQPRLETRLAEQNDPHLKPGEADVVLIVNTYIYLQDRVDYLKNLKNGIAEGGRILIIDFKKKRTPIGPPSEFRVPLFQVEEELYEAGYKNIVTNDSALDYQYIILAER